MKSRKHVSTMQMAEMWAQKYLDLKSEIAEREALLEPLKVNLKTYLKDATPAQRAILSQREFFMCEVTQEKFDLKRARQAISDKLLKPFVKLVSSEQLRYK